MHTLDLFSGAGGSALAHIYLLGCRVVGYVENNLHCQRLLAARIRDGWLHEAPIFGDIRAFNAEYARSYRGLVECIAAGPPCQPFSKAGKSIGADDPRNLWPATLECIGLVRPRIVHMENVPGLNHRSSERYFTEIIGELTRLGYDCAWSVLSAKEVGALHERERLWIVANAYSIHAPE